MTVNAPFTEKVLLMFLREEVRKLGFGRVVLGLSGGLDSAVCAALAARALTPERVLAMVMPYGPGDDPDTRDAEAWARELGVEARRVDIAPMVDAYFERHPTDDRVLRGNKMARERMSILYDVSGREKALILGTSNKTELLIGYGTIHGDMASGINPMGDLYKTQVRVLAEHLGVPEPIRRKAPTAGLWAGQTDEDEIGFPYRELDLVLEALVDRRQSRDEAIAAGFAAKLVDEVRRRMRDSEFKRRMPPIPKLSPRSVGHDFLYPYDWGK